MPSDFVPSRSTCGGSRVHATCGATEFARVVCHGTSPPTRQIVRSGCRRTTRATPPPPSVAAPAFDRGSRETPSPPPTAGAAAEAPSRAVSSVSSRDGLSSPVFRVSGSLPRRATRDARRASFGDSGTRDERPKRARATQGMIIRGSTLAHRRFAATILLRTEATPNGPVGRSVGRAYPFSARHRFDEHGTRQARPLRV